MGGGGPNPHLHQPRLPAGKSNSRSKLESPTRKLQLENPTRKDPNWKVQLDSPTRNPNSVPSLSLGEPTFLTFLRKTRRIVSMRNTDLARLELEGLLYGQANFFVVRTLGKVGSAGRVTPLPRTTFLHITGLWFVQMFQIFLRIFKKLAVQHERNV